MQRDRVFSDYQDPEAAYHRRPSAWVEPVGDWGPGSVQLVELPTNDETADNIVAFWTPEAPAAAGRAFDLRYRLHWTAEEPNALGVARVVSTRFGRGGQPGRPPLAGARRYVIDFGGGPLADLAPDDEVEAVVTLSEGRPMHLSVQTLPGPGRRRVTFDVQAPKARALELRAYLRRGDAALTETWLSQMPPG
jgi:glucans biosynthesis protein